MADATVLIPWRAGCRHREAAWTWLRPRYEALGLEVIEADCDGPWSKARAVAAAVERTDADHLLVADADVWCDPIDALCALEDFGWAVPHQLVHRLTEASTAQLIAGDDTDLELEMPAYGGVRGGGMVAIRRDVLHQVPLDPRFVGWGGEDHSWGIALHALAGAPWPGRLDLLHLWHPPQPEAPPVRGPRAKVKVPNDANRRLHQRYRDAKPSRARMEALVNEAREALWLSTVS